MEVLTRCVSRLFRDPRKLVSSIHLQKLVPSGTGSVQAFAMEYRGKQYVIFEDENSNAWIWAVTLDGDTTKTGETASRGEAITMVVLAVDQAMSTARRGQSIAF
jgi:hypothetical protein